ncbi:MAG: hypothetical protein IJL09_10355 [Lachnospiraceae bacterium]|nr:hypothetical protein [Lachnospiraceae bacterium]
MFKAMNQNEMMNVNGGFYYVPCYWYGKFTGLTQVASNSGIKKYVNGKAVY